ncbi:MAG: CCA tRNA nucleotidyltransferase [Gemmatimonadaceae bacterium]|nr:CCA tRNA nucleotidyltransferase [Gemmatimonadaceae bacterium]
MPEGSVPTFEVPHAVLDIARRLEEAGHETWCVGGAVRDALLGIPHLDWDLATAATPPQVRRLFRRTIPVGEAFGTIAVLDPSGTPHEVTTFRHDVRTDGRHAEVEFGASLDEDLARRDFTINAMAWSPSRRLLHDPFGGRADLARRVVAAVGDPRRRMAEDRLRALRALRFAGRFDFTIAPATWDAIVESAPALHRLSKERVQQELVKTLEQVREPGRSLRLWSRSGALRELLPALAAAPPSVLEAADGLALPDASSDAGIARRRTLVRLGAILTGLGRDDVVGLLTGLRFSNRDVQRLAHATTVAHALRPALIAAAPVTDITLRHWASQAGRADLADTLRMAMAAPRRAATRAWCGLYRRSIRCAYRDPVEISDLVVDGEDLMQGAGVVPGPRLGEVLRALRDFVLEDPARNDREVLLARARELASASQR